MECRGVGFVEGRDFLVFGEIRKLGDRRILALSFAEDSGGAPFFCRVAGVADGQGGCGGYSVGRAGGFSGELFAVEGDKLLLCGASFSAGPGGKGGGACGESGNIPGVEADAPAESAKPGVGPKTRKEEPGSVQAVPIVVSGGGGKEPGGEALRVVKPVEAEDFPVADGFPELGEVKREDLARKAEARKKDDGKGGKKSGVAEPRVSKGGLRLGKELPGDKPGSGGHNTIDESELW